MLQVADRSPAARPLKLAGLAHAQAMGAWVNPRREGSASLPDDTWFYPGHGNDSTLGAERPHFAEWRERGW